MKKNRFSTIFVSLFIGLLVIGLTGCNQQQITLPPVSLEYWGVEDHESALQLIVEEYQKTHPHVAINYTKFDEDDYEKKLLEALAENKGPDIFSIPARDMRLQRNKIAPLPKELTIRQLNEEGIPTEITSSTLSLRKLQNDYFDLVAQRVVMEEEQRFNEQGAAIPREKYIFGLPFSLDTLALYYNKDLLEAAGITEPAKTWGEVRDHVLLLTDRSEQAANYYVRQSGAALGTADNVLYYSDILAALMMQNGALIFDEEATTPLFAQVPPGSSAGVPPAIDAADFYTSFASPIRDQYTWNDDLPDSLDAFTQGRVAYFFGYAGDYDVIKERSPKLVFDVSAMPQVAGNRVVNVAKYRIQTVSAKSQQQEYAWDFLQFAVRLDNNERYLSEYKRPTAMRALLVNQRGDERLDVFASQVLTARDWFPGYDYEKMEDVFKTLIQGLLEGRFVNVEEGLQLAALEALESLYEPTTP